MDMLNPCNVWTLFTEKGLGVEWGAVVEHGLSTGGTEEKKLGKKVSEGVQYLASWEVTFLGLPGA